MEIKCPECKSNESVEYIGEDRPSESGEMYDVRVYKCYKCDIEFDTDEIDDRISITNKWDRALWR